MTLKVLFPLSFVLLFSVNISAQDITAQLSGSTETAGFTVNDSVDNPLFTVRGNGNAGFGTKTPAFKLSLENDGGILAKGKINTGVILSPVQGPVMMWYPRKAAFRAGGAYLGTWDDAKIGLYSFATGSVSTANGRYSTAFGLQTTASGEYSVAMGYVDTASGRGSVAMGLQTTASGLASMATGNQTTAAGSFSTSMGFQSTASGHTSMATGYQVTASGTSSNAIGYRTTASGDYSTAMGHADTASGNYSTAIGYKTIARGQYAIAIGTNTTADGEHTVAIGSYVSTNGFWGTMYLGDASKTTIRKANEKNRFYAVFNGGYTLYTNGSGSAPYCVYLDHNSNSWKSCSDSTKKENYRAADGEEILVKFSAMRLGSWNYKGQDAGQYRHYGPMAQEWFTAFGRDGVGLIGNDTSLSSADVDGIAYIAIQALERRTAELGQTVVELHKTTNKLGAKTEEMEAMKEELEALRRKVLQMDRLKAEVSEIRSILRKFAGLKPETANTGELHPCMDQDAENNTLLSRK